MAGMDGEGRAFGSVEGSGDSSTGAGDFAEGLAQAAPQQSGRSELTPVQLDGYKDSAVVFDSSVELADARFIRDGDDLLVKVGGGRILEVKGYFADSSVRPVLVDSNGVEFPGDLVEAFLEVEEGGSFQVVQSEVLVPVGEVGLVEGVVKIVRGGVSSDLGLGEIVYVGDVIEVQGDGAARIQLADESIVTVGDGARLLIDEFIYGSASDDQTVLSIIKGQLLYISGQIAAENYEQVQIKSPVNNVAIRGTVFGLNIDPNDPVQGVQVSLLAGSVAVRDADEEVVLDQSFGSVASGYASQIGQGIRVQPDSDIGQVLADFGNLLLILDDVGLLSVQNQISEQLGAPFDIREKIQRALEDSRARGEVAQNDREGGRYDKASIPESLGQISVVDVSDNNDTGDSGGDSVLPPVAKVVGNILVAPLGDGPPEDQPPYFEPGAQQVVSIAEGDLPFLGSYRAFSAQGSDVEYRLVGPDADLFVISPQGVLQPRQVLDAERALDANGNPVPYILQVEAVAGNGQSSFFPVEVWVDNVNDEAPQVSGEADQTVLFSFLD